MPDEEPHLMTIFGEALELADPVLRKTYLDRSCGENTELRRRVEDLLAAHARAGRFLEPDHPSEPATVTSPGATGSFSGDKALSAERTTGEHLPVEATGTFEGTTSAGRTTGLDSGTVIAGRYTLLEVIGEGGMGTVYRASQSEPVKRLVALKLIKVGMDSKAVLARFDAERQALALMDHPNIARVFDGGTTSTGQPFFVMELVRGVPITDYCDRQRLPVRARLELFVAVCQAVQHAHQKSIIHRDLKPGNVLVTEVDGRPTPKVIDFGVAKATEQKLTDMSFADTGAIVGTPAYMSPEQADPSSMDIDTRTDVYALGVILYELLVGSPPLDAKQFKKGAILEMMRMVREVDPPRPSTKLSTSEALPNIAANRNIEPSQLKRALRGDLDWIVMKSLEKDRTRRYDTANGFAADVLRHLAHEPVLAAPPSRIYRLRKFVRKNRGAVMAASLVLLALLAGIAGTTWGLISAEIRRGEAERARADESKRVEERDEAIGKRDTALWEANVAISRRDEAIQVADARAEELKYRVGISNMILAGAAYDNCDVSLAAERLDAVPLGQRGWEWQFLKQKARGGLFTLYGHTSVVLSASYSPDGMRIVTGSMDKEAKVWDARTGKVLLDLRGHKWRVSSVAFSPDGTRIISGGGEIHKPGDVKVWDSRSGRVLLELVGHKDAVSSVAFSPDGMRIITGGFDKTAKVWDAKTGKQLLELNSNSQYEFVSSVAFSPDGMRIITGHWCGRAKLWDARTGKILLVFKGHARDVFSVGFSPDGSRVVTGSGDKTVKVWDARTGTVLFDLKGHAKGVFSVSFSPDGTRIVSGSYDNTARVWDARTGTHVLDLKGHRDAVAGVAFSPDGTRIITASHDKTAKVWDSQTGTHLVQLKGGGARSLSFSPDGTRLVTGSPSGTAKVWDVRTGLSLLELKGHKSQVLGVSYSPDGRLIVTASNDGTARVWDAQTGTSLSILKPTSSLELQAAQFSPDGTRIVTGGVDNSAKVWDARTGAHLLSLKGHESGVCCIGYSPDGTQIVTGGIYDKTAKVWDARTGQLLFDLNGHANNVLSVSFSPDGKRIVTGSGDFHNDRELGGVKVWDILTKTSQFDLKGHSGPIYCATFSPDGRRILTSGSDRTAKVWDAQTGAALLDLKGHDDEVTSAAFSPNGELVATGSSDDTVRVWDARNRMPAIDLNGNAELISSVAFSQDCKRLVTGCSDGTAKVWDTKTGNALLNLNGGHAQQVSSISFNSDGTRIITTGWDGKAKLWDANNGTLLLELQHKFLYLQGAAFSPDGTRIVTGGGVSREPGEVKLWDAKAGSLLFDLKGHADIVWGVTFSLDGTRIVTFEYSGSGAKVWDAKTGVELKGEPVPKNPPSKVISPDGQLIAQWDAKRFQLIPLVPAADEISHRILLSCPKFGRYQEEYYDAIKAKDEYASRFYLDRILSLPEGRTTPQFMERNTLQSDPLVVARTSFHHPTLAQATYDRGIIQFLAIKGDRLAMRLVAQEYLREGKPGPAIPMLFQSLLSRPVTEPPAPPVEELLLAQAYLALKQPEEAKRFYRTAAEWLDRPLQPIRVSNIVTQCALNPWAGLAAPVTPVEDLRRNPFDWESWHECDVFRADVERRLSGKQ